ncbi:MAG: hypothetical protein IJG77_02570 [Aeriscardovia sp.]|nr:hypothetical protein [Aeriscardovia sp.]
MEREDALQKAFATYGLAKRIGLRRILVLTFNPAVESAWQEDLLSYADSGG